MTSRPNVPAIFPSASSISRSAASLRRVPRGEFPGFAGTYQPTPTSRPPSRLTSSPSLGTTTASPSSLPRSRTIPRGPGPLLSRRPRRLITVERTRYPRFLGDPCVHAPLFDPGGPPAPGHYRAGDVVFRTVNDVDSAYRVLSRLNHAACTLSVYASQPGSPPVCATLDSGWWPALTGQDSHLLGRVEGFRHVYPSTWLPPSPGFAWRNNYSPVLAIHPSAILFRPHGFPPSRESTMFGNRRLVLRLSS